jgi:hypothetical protein
MNIFLTLLTSVTADSRIRTECIAEWQSPSVHLSRKIIRRQKKLDLIIPV